jgi:alpha-1,6-mannosyltransferase
MKTLHLTNSWHPRSGGIRTFYSALFAAAEARGQPIRLVVPGETTRVDRVGLHGLIYQVEAPRAPVSPSYRILYPQQLLIPGSPVHQILAEEEPDVVEICDKFTMNYLGGLLRVGMLPGIRFRPVVVGLSCERLDRTCEVYAGPSRFWRRFAQTYLRWLYFPLADHHIAVSEFVAAELREVAGGHKVQRGVWVGPMGVDARRLESVQRSPAARREVLALTGGDEHSVVLVYAGRIASEKNLPLLLDTMQELSERSDGERYRLLLVGDGDAKSELMQRAESALPGVVHFTAHRADPLALAELLAACDVFAHPNPWEPFGIAPLEAMAAGVPLVAPNSGGVLSYANESNAWLAPPCATEFARAVVDTESDGDTRARKVAAARQTALANEWPAAAGRYLDLYFQLHALVRRTAAPAAGFEPSFYSYR